MIRYQPRPGATEASANRQERAAALLERAYRMALTLKDCLTCSQGEGLADSPEAFAQIAVSIELVELLDEARCAQFL